MLADVVGETFLHRVPASEEGVSCGSLTVYRPAVPQKGGGLLDGARNFLFIFCYSIPLQTRTAYRPKAVVTKQGYHTSQ